MLSLIPQN